MLGVLSDAVTGFTGIGAENFTGDLDDRWYQPNLGGLSPAGVMVSEYTIFLCGVVLAAVRWRADIFSQAQPSVIRRRGKTREEVPDHYAQRVLRKPCLWQTGVRWRHLQMVRMQLGNSYCRIVGSSRAVVEELRPVETDRMHVKSQRPDGSLVYEYTPPAAVGPPETLGQEQVLHLRGFSLDGREGVAMYDLIRNAVGIALQAERHTSTTLRKGARIAGLLIPEGDVGGDEKRKELADSVNAVFSAHENTGAMGVLPWGVKFQALSMDHQKAQLLELRDFQVGDILRFLGVPGVVVGWGEKTATYASASEFFEEAKRCVLPWVVSVEAEEQDALLPPDTDLSIKHNLDAVLRADTTKRYEALQKATGRPWMTGNEARAIEDMDDIADDPTMDKVAPPPNMTADSGGEPVDEEAPSSAPPAGPRRVTEDEEEAAALAAAAERFRRSAFQAWTDIGGRVVRRELSEVSAALGRPRYRDREAWGAWVARFYDQHEEHVAEALHLAPYQAREFAERRRAELLAGDAAAVLAAWTAEYLDTAAELAHLAVHGGDE